MLEAKAFSLPPAEPVIGFGTQQNGTPS